MNKSILICLAHPDDETGCASLVARYRTEGVQATLICATNGDVGTVDAKHLQGYSSIPELRLAELECATKVAGYSEVVPFGYRDSGMMGSADNQEATSFWQASEEEVTQRVIEVMRRVHPQVVITFNTFGMYGHPDHIKIHQATLAAFGRLQSEAEHPQKLYYVTGPKALFRVLLVLMKVLRKNPRKMGTNGDMDMVAALASLTRVTTSIPVARYMAVAWKVTDCYASQISLPPIVRLLRRPLGLLFQRFTALSRVYPAPRLDESIEHDLFEKVVEPRLSAPLEA